MGEIGIKRFFNFTISPTQKHPEIPLLRWPSVMSHQDTFIHHGLTFHPYTSANLWPHCGTLLKPLQPSDPPCVRNLWAHTASRDSFMGPSKMTRNLGRDHVSRAWLIEFTKGFAMGFALFKTQGWQCTAQLNSIIPCLLEPDLMTFLHFSGLTVSIQNHCVCIEIYMLSSSFEISRTHGFWKIQR